MVKKLVSFALSYPLLVMLFTGIVVIGGLYAFHELPIEAYPNPVPPLVETLVQPPGWAAEEVERYVTIPLEVGLSGMPGLDHIRSQSLFELSDVKCYFKWGTDYWAARQEVINRIQFVQLPPGLTAQLSPWNAIGEVFRYVLKGKGYTLKDLKAAEDFTLERQWKQVPGVIDVTSYGGETKEYHVEVDPYRMRARGIALNTLTGALGNANANTGGNRVFLGEQTFDVRSLGLIKTLTDIGDIVVTEAKDKNGNPTGNPIRVRDIANVVIGFAPRLGMVGKSGGCPLELHTQSWWDRLFETREERAERERLDNPPEQRDCKPESVPDEPDVVQGIILMRYGGQTKATLEGIYNRIEYIRRNHILPPGMQIEPYYDRENLVNLTTHTVMENLLVGMLLVMIVQVLFLGNLRAALITAVVIPISLLIAFLGMYATGTPANLISIGAVDFGIVVDSSVIMMENFFKHLGKHGHGSMRERIEAAAAEVGRPMFISTFIIGIAFLPLFTLSGVSGVLFSPMARTYAFAISGAIMLALLVVPVLSNRFIPPDAEEEESRFMHFLHRIYDPLFDAALKKPKLAIALRAIPIVAVFVLFPLLGRDFMPKLEEGNFWIRATLPMSISMPQSAKYTSRMRAILRSHPEVVSVVSQLGRPDDGTDVTGFFNIEFFCPLKPFDEWPRGLTKPKLTEIVQKELQDAFPGVVFNFSQYISDNVEEAIAGVKGENSIKVTGPDMKVNETKAEQIVDVLSTVKGVTDLGMMHTLGQPDIKIIPDRTICARYGLNTGDIGATVQGAIGDVAVTQVYEGEKFFALTVRWQEPYRTSIEAIRQITVQSPDGNFLPLGQLASITRVEGPASIYREDGRRYVPVKFSVRGRDLAGTIEDAQREVAKKVKLPYDTYLVWSGEINELREATHRLAIIVPLTIALIALLIYIAVKNWLDLVIVLIDIPVACTGGVLALLITGTHFSVSAAMGFVSIFGIAVMDALLMVMYFQQLHFEQGMSVEQAARVASEKRFRPVLMTSLTAILGLLPAALSNGIGSQTQKPLAIVVIGGALQLAILTRLLQPPMRVIAYRWLEARRRRKTGEGEPHVT
jgi:cobalt-zinc-cadmium resistance protein CzcA